MTKKMTFDEYKKEMPKPFEKVKEGGTAITPAQIEQKYGEILKVGMKLLKDWFKTGEDEYRTDLTGYPKTKWRKDHQYIEFAKEFTTTKVGGQSERTRLWDAVKLASQEVWLQNLELGRLSNREKMKLIGTQNNDAKILKCKALLGIKETDEKKRQRAVKQAVEAISTNDVIQALKSGDLGFFDSVARLEPVIRTAKGEEAKDLMIAFTSRIKKIEKNILPLLRAMASMVTIEDED